MLLCVTWNYCLKLWQKIRRCSCHIYLMSRDINVCEIIQCLSQAIHFINQIFHWTLTVNYMFLVTFLFWRSTTPKTEKAASGETNRSGSSEANRSESSETSETNRSASRETNRLGSSETNRAVSSEVNRSGSSETNRSGSSEANGSGSSEANRSGSSEADRSGSSEVNRSGCSALLATYRLNMIIAARNALLWWEYSI